MSERIETITVYVGQKKATNFSREVFDANESVTLDNTTAEEAGLLRKILRVKLLGSVTFDMIAYDDMLSESLMPEDVISMVRISNHQLDAFTQKISESDNDTLPNKAELVAHLGVARGIIGDIEEQLG